MECIMMFVQEHHKLEDHKISVQPHVSLRLQSILKQTKGPQDTEIK